MVMAEMGDGSWSVREYWEYWLNAEPGIKV
jgi:hypothetical protein